MDIKTRWKRTKGTRLISAEGTFLLFPSPRDGVKLEISASPDTWRTLYIMSLARPADIVSIIRNLSKATFDYMTVKPRKEGYGDREDFIDKVKRYSAYVYCWTRYWLKKPEDIWPEPLKELVRRMGRYPDRGRREGSKSRIITAYIMERDFGKERKRYRLKKWTENPEVFWRTFILNNEYARFVKVICRG